MDGAEVKRMTVFVFLFIAQALRQTAVSFRRQLRHAQVPGQRANISPNGGSYDGEEGERGRERGEGDQRGGGERRGRREGERERKSGEGEGGEGGRRRGGEGEEGGERERETVFVQISENRQCHNGMVLRPVDTHRRGMRAGAVAVGTTAGSQRRGTRTTSGIAHCNESNYYDRARCRGCKEHVGKLLQKAAADSGKRSSGKGTGAQRYTAREDESRNTTETSSSRKDDRGNGRQPTHNGVQTTHGKRTQKNFEEAQQTTDPWHFKSTPNKIQTDREEQRIKTLKGELEVARKSLERRKTDVQRQLEELKEFKEATAKAEADKIKEDLGKTLYELEAHTIKGHLDKQRRMANLTEEASSASSHGLHMTKQKASISIAR